MRVAFSGPTRRLLPALIAASAVLHLGLVILASAALNARADSRVNLVPIRVVVSGRRQTQLARVQHASVPAPRHIELPRPATAFPQVRAATSLPSLFTPRPPRATQTAALPEQPQTTPQAAAGQQQMPQPPQTMVRPLSRLGAFNPFFWQGAPGPAGEAAGGGAQVIASANPGSGGFTVSIPAASGGTGPGLGGDGSGIGSGGGGSGVGMGGGPGHGDGGGGPQGQGNIAGPAGGAEAGPGEGGSSTHRAPEPPRTTPEPEPPAPELKPVPKPEPAQPSPADLSEFRSMVQSRINRARRYPSEARSQSQQGSVKVSFRVAPSGSPSDVSVVTSSGYQLLDAEAQRAVGRSGSFLPFPRGLDKSIKVTVTVVFRLD